SDNPDAPTFLSFNAGTNSVSGDVVSSNLSSFSGGDGTGDRDFFNFTIGAGQELESIVLTDYPSGNTGFAAIFEGGTGQNPSGLSGTVGDLNLILGSVLIGPTNVELLPDFGTPVSGIGIGFSGNLGPGTYTFVVQQTGPQFSPYTFEFGVTPAPGATAALGLVGLAATRRRR
ncbi:MAG: hypothetical protein AAFU70_07885, partial [Planctomycetota bacterium]